MKKILLLGAVLLPSVAFGQAAHSAIELTRQRASQTAACGSTSTACLYRSTDDSIHWAEPGGTDFNLTLSAGTLQSAYSGGGAGPQTITLSTAGKDIRTDVAGHYPGGSGGVYDLAWSVIDSTQANRSGTPFTPAPPWPVPGTTVASPLMALGMTQSGELITGDPQRWLSAGEGMDGNIVLRGGLGDWHLFPGPSLLTDKYVEGVELWIQAGSGAPISNAFGGSLHLHGGPHGVGASAPGGMVEIDSAPDAGGTHSGFYYSGYGDVQLGGFYATTIGIGRADLTGSPATQVALRAGTNGIQATSLGRVVFRNADSSPTVYWDTVGPTSSGLEFAKKAGSFTVLLPNDAGLNQSMWAQDLTSITLSTGVSPAYNEVFTAHTHQGMRYTTYNADGLGNVAFTVASSVTWTTTALAQFKSASLVRADIQSGPASVTGIGVINAYGNLGSAATIAQFNAVAVSADGGFSGAGYAMDATPAGGDKAFLTTGGTVGNTSLAHVAALYNGSYQGAYVDLADGSFKSLAVKLGTGGTPNLGSAAVPWGSIYVTGTIAEYKGETTDGTGVAYIEKKGTDVASSGAGAQSTTIATYSPGTSGLYRVQVLIDCTTADTVTATVTYSDAVNTTAQTETPISAASCGTNGVVHGADLLIRAASGTAIIATLTLSSHNTTKAHATIERLN
jgi:hypothetical protein